MPDIKTVEFARYLHNNNKNYCFSIYGYTIHTHTHRERGRERAQLTIPHRFKFHSKVAAVGAASVDVVAVVFNFHVDDGLTNEPRKRRTSLFLFFFQNKRMQRQLF